MSNTAKIRKIISQSLSWQERLNFTSTHCPKAKEEKYLKEWLSALDASGVEKIEKRLAWQGLNLDQAKTTWGEVTLPKDYSLPLWAKILQEVFQISETFSEITLEKESPLYSEVVSPFLSYAKGEFRRQNLELYDSFSESAHQEFLASLQSRLLSLVSPTLKTKHSLFQSAHAPFMPPFFSKESKLYKKFIAQYQGGKEISLWEEFPVLARLLATTTEFWLSFGKDLLHRLFQDRQDLENIFQLSPKSQVCQLKANLSDPHNQGRCVVYFVFEDGSKLFYKPKSLAIDEAFYQFLTWSNEKGLSPLWKTVPLLDRGDYGWMELVEKEEADLLLYYRAGMLICIFYLLDGYDFIEDNLIIQKDHLIPIDLEALFRCQTNQQDFWISGTVFPESILSSHLLFQGKEPSPLLKTIPPEFESDLINGFCHMYSFCLEKREDFRQYIQENFPEKKVRGVFQDTGTYQRIFLRSLLPKYVKDGILRSIFLERVYRVTFCYPKAQKFSRLAQAELEMLWQGDIPHLTFSSSGHDLELGEMGTILDAFPCCGHENALQKLAQMNEKDQELQAKILQSCFILKDEIIPSSSPSLTDFLYKEKRPKEEKEMRSETQVELAQIAEKIASLSMNGIEGPTWLSISSSEQRSSFFPMGYSIYNGKLGIVLFLAIWQKVAQTKKYETHIESTLAYIAECVNRKNWLDSFLPHSHMGFSGGMSGMIYALLKMGQLGGKESALELSLRIAEQIPFDKIKPIENLDVGDGWGGILLVWLALYEESSEQKFLDQASYIGKCLIQEKENIKKPCSGFFHGYAGMSYALFRLYKFTQEQAFYEQATKWIHLERDFFVKESQNWLVSGSTPEEPRYWTQYCHGSAGIGLGRLGSYSIYNDSLILSEIEIALNTTYKDLTLPFDFLCCGQMGSVDLFITAGEKLDPKYHKWAWERVSLILERKKEQGRLSYSPQIPIEDPSLFRGLAGIGYQLLRLQNPQEFPSLLLLE